MAAFCRYWRMTPAEYRALTLEEFGALAEFMVDDLRRQKQH